MWLRQRRHIPAATMLTFCLLWGAGIYTVRRLAALGQACNWCQISDIALLKRMRKARRFVAAATNAILSTAIKRFDETENEKN